MNNALKLLQNLKTKICVLFKDLQNDEDITNYNLQSIYFDLFESLTIIENELKALERKKK